MAVFERVHADIFNARRYTNGSQRIAAGKSIVPYFPQIIAQEDIFEIMNSRRNEANGEPTRSFLIGTRIGGAIIMLIGIGGFVALLIERLSG